MEGDSTAVKSVHFSWSFGGGMGVLLFDNLSAPELALFLAGLSLVSNGMFSVTIHVLMVNSNFEFMAWAEAGRLHAMRFFPLLV